MFLSEEGGLCVLRVKVEGHRDLVKVAGRVPSGTALREPSGAAAAQTSPSVLGAFRPTP